MRKITLAAGTLLIALGTGGCSLIREPCQPQVQCEKPLFLCGGWVTPQPGTTICTKGVIWRENQYQEIEAVFTDVGE